MILKNARNLLQDHTSQDCSKWKSFIKVRLRLGIINHYHRSHFCRALFNKYLPLHAIKEIVEIDSLRLSSRKLLPLKSIAVGKNEFTTLQFRIDSRLLVVALLLPTHCILSHVVTIVRTFFKFQLPLFSIDTLL